MDVGLLIPGAMVAVGLPGLTWHCWSTRRRPQPEVAATRSHVEKVPAQIVPGEGPRGDAGQGVVALPASPRTSSLAVDTWAKIAGGSEWEAKLATAERRIAQHQLFGDGALRRTSRTPDGTA